jgi:hypothetical protein
MQMIIILTPAPFFISFLLLLIAAPLSTHSCIDFCQEKKRKRKKSFHNAIYFGLLLLYLCRDFRQQLNQSRKKRGRERARESATTRNKELPKCCCCCL